MGTACAIDQRNARGAIGGAEIALIGLNKVFLRALAEALAIVEDARVAGQAGVRCVGAGLAGRSAGHASPSQVVNEQSSTT